MKTLITLLLIAAATSTAFAANNTDARLTKVFEDDEHQFTGVAVSKSGRMFVSYPRWTDANLDKSLVEIVDGKKRAFPDRAWNTGRGRNGTNEWVCVQAVYVDDEDNLWVVDPAAPKMGAVEKDAAKLVKIDLKTDRVSRIYNLTSVVGKDSYLNDVRVETKHKTAYLTESKNGGIVVLDLASGEARLVLEKHYSVKSDPNHQFRVNGEELIKEGKPLKINSDGIALHPEGEWLYYKPLTDKKLHRARTEDLRNASLSESDLAKKVNDLGAQFSTSDGMTFDKQGNLYLSDVENNAVVRMDRETKKIETVVKDKRLLWPDSFAWGSDGSLYVTCSQIQNMEWFHDGRETRKTPYTIYKLKVSESGFAQTTQ